MGTSSAVKAQGQSPSVTFRLTLLAFMVLQNTSTVLVGRYTRSSVSKEDAYVVNHLIVVTEIAKFLGSCILESIVTNGQMIASFKENVFSRPLDSLKVAVPALLYLLQNTLLYVALSNLSAPLFQVTYQGKLLTTAIVSVILLQRKYSPKQWVCLTTLGIGVAVVVLGENKKKDDQPDAQETDVADQVTLDDADADADGDDPGRRLVEDVTAKGNLITGLVAVSIACLSSALAGVYFEMVIKKPTKEGDTPRAPVSVWMRNVQLAFFSVVIGVFQFHALKGDDAKKPWMHGFTIWVWILVALQAGGGLLVAAVIKYADNVLKGLATGVSVVTSTLLSMVFFKTPMTFQFCFGAFMILASVYLFSNDFPGFPSRKKTDTATKDDVEMAKPLVNK